MKSCDFTTNEFKRKCRDGKVSKTVRVKYNDREEDVFYLCEKCTDNITKEAEMKGWQLVARDYASR